jgi:hypothetical protein
MTVAHASVRQTFLHLAGPNERGDRADHPRPGACHRSVDRGQNDAIDLLCLRAQKRVETNDIGAVVERRQASLGVLQADRQRVCRLIWVGLQATVTRLNQSTPCVAAGRMIRLVTVLGEGVPTRSRPYAVPAR